MKPLPVLWLFDFAFNTLAPVSEAAPLQVLAVHNKLHQRHHHRHHHRVAVT